jgi:hypothetical protein
MAIGYTLAGLSAGRRRQSLVLWAVFLVSVIPDFDEFFARAGVTHSTYTHSLIFLVPIAVILVYWRRQAFPYAVALLSHVAADMMIEGESIFFPLSKVTYGLRFGMSSGVDAALEAGLLVVMIVFMWRSGDLRRLVGGSSENTGMVAPLVFLTGSLLIAASRMFVLRRGLSNISLGSNSLPLVVITVGHTVLVLLFAYSLGKSLIGRTRVHKFN